MKRGAPDEVGTANPTPGIERVYAFGISQPARFLRDFVDLGFNRGRGGERVLDGILNFIAGPSGGFFNFRFAQPARTHRQRIGRNDPEREFPFACQVRFDPVTERIGRRGLRCALTRTCPRILEANPSNEYWVKGGSLLHFDTRGRGRVRRATSATICSRASRTRPPRDRESASSRAIRSAEASGCGRCWSTHEDYVNRVAQAAMRLREQRLLLDEDVRRSVDVARASDVRR
jgi:hypothetical protein